MYLDDWSLYYSIILHTCRAAKLKDLKTITFLEIGKNGEKFKKDVVNLMNNLSSTKWEFHSMMKVSTYNRKVSEIVLNLYHTLCRFNIDLCL